jgi:hypothetical protein
MKDKLEHEPKGSLGPIIKTVEPTPSVEQLKKDTENNFSDMMEIIKDLEARLVMIERKLAFIVLPNFRTEDDDDDDWFFDGSYGGTD